MVEKAAKSDTDVPDDPFDDSDNNNAYGDYDVAVGFNNQTGILGYYVSRVWGPGVSDTTTKSAFIFVEDLDKTPKAFDAYAVDDVIQYDAKGHWYNLFKITELFKVTDEMRNEYPELKSVGTRIKIERIDGLPIHGDGIYLDTEEHTPERIDNWVYVIGKQGAESVRYSRAVAAFGDGNTAVGHASFVSGRDNVQIGPYGNLSGRNNEGNYCTDVSGYKNTVKAKFSSARGSNNVIEVQAENSHVVGKNNKITAPNCYVEGTDLVANKSNLILLGSYNDYEKFEGTYESPALIVGGGYSSTRINAFELYKNGTAYLRDKDSGKLEKIATLYNIGLLQSQLDSLFRRLDDPDGGILARLKNHDAQLAILWQTDATLESKLNNALARISSLEAELSKLKS